MQPTSIQDAGELTINHNTDPQALTPASSPYQYPGATENLYQPASPPPPATPPRPRRARRAPTPAPQPPAPLPQIVQAITPAPARTTLADVFLQVFRPRRKKRRNLQHIIEHNLETPVFFIVSFMMIIRTAQLYSGGALIFSKLLGPNYPIFEIVSGFGLGVGSEMLMTIAGRSWKAWEAEATDTIARPGMSKVARQAYTSKARQAAAWSRRVMFVGMAASLFAGLAFLLTNNGKPFDTAVLHDGGWWFALFSDLVAITVITTTVFYLGVLRETRARSDAEEAIEELREAMNEAVKAAIRRFHAGKQTGVDEKLIAENLPHDMQGKFLRAVAKENRHKTWTSRQLRERLGIGNDETQNRKLRGRILALSKDPDNGLTKAPDGKTWLIPVAVIRDEWDEEIAAKDAERLLALKQTA